MYLPIIHSKDPCIVLRFESRFLWNLNWIIINCTSYVGYLWLLQKIQNITTVWKHKFQINLLQRRHLKQEQKYDVNDKHTCKIKWTQKISEPWDQLNSVTSKSSNFFINEEELDLLTLLCYCSLLTSTSKKSNKININFFIYVFTI